MLANVLERPHERRPRGGVRLLELPEDVTRLVLQQRRLGRPEHLAQRPRHARSVAPVAQREHGAVPVPHVRGFVEEDGGEGVGRNGLGRRRDRIDGEVRGIGVDAVARRTVRGRGRGGGGRGRGEPLLGRSEGLTRGGIVRGVLRLPAFRARVLEPPHRERRRLAHDPAAVDAGVPQRVDALLRGDGSQRLGALVPYHLVVRRVPQHPLEDAHRPGRLHLPKREGDLVAEQRRGIVRHGAQQRGHGVVAADAAQGEERAEPSRHGQRLVHQLGSVRLDAHGASSTRVSE